MDYSLLKAEIQQKRPDIDLALVDLAYTFAKEAHEGQTRYSGEPYIIHPVAATSILLRLNPDLATIQACLLHDVTEDTESTLEEIEAAFGADVAVLVKGCEKLAVVHVKDSGPQDEGWQRMFLAMSRDVRIVFIKLADRLHNMQTLEFVPEEKQSRIAKESMLVHAAIASRLGIYQIKSELQDLCFKYLYPEEYKELSEQVAAHRERSEECMAYSMSELEQLFMREGIKVEKVQGRMKHLWSIREKLLAHDTSDVSRIYDLFALRVILPDLERNEQEDVSHLYSTLGLLHNEYLPLQDRFKDYVAVPKPNGYRSLHTTLLGLGGDLYDEATEVQIRTMTMHREAEIGVASHSAYKMKGKNNTKIDHKRHFDLRSALQKVQALVATEPDISGVVKEWVESYQHMHPEDRRSVEQLLRDRGIQEDDLVSIRKGRSQEQLTLRPNVEQQLAWLKGLAESDQKDSELDLYPDKIFVLTPSQKVIQLRKGSTPIDFAYAIHTEVGNRMVHAKVNGRIVPLEYELKNGEVVEVGTRNNAQPSRYWLSIAKTSSARAKIRNWFNRQDREINVAAGRDILNHQLHIMGKSQLDEKLTLLKNYNGKERNLYEREQLLESLALGAMTVSNVLKTVFPGESVQEEAKPRLNYAHETLTEKVLITGEEDLPMVLSACCKPKPPHAIIGYVSRGRRIRVHRQSCQELSGLEGDRFVSAHWGGE